RGACTPVRRCRWRAPRAGSLPRRRSPTGCCTRCCSPFRCRGGCSTRPPDPRCSGSACSTCRRSPPPAPACAKPRARRTNGCSGCWSRWPWSTPPPPSTTTCSSATPPWHGCSRAAGWAPPIPPRRNPAMRSILLFAALALCALPARAADWVQAPGSSLVFAGTYQGEVFSGHFPGFQTRLSFDPADPASAKLEVDIPLAGVTTGNPDYDGEMRGAAFFDVGRYARARYVADGFRVLEDGSYAADGILELRGTSHPVTLA